MKIRQKMRLPAVLLSVVLAGTSQSALPMSQDHPLEQPAGLQSTSQLEPLTHTEMEFLLGPIQGKQSPVLGLAYLDEHEMRKTEGRSGPAAVGGFVGGVAASALNDLVNGNSISVKNAIAWGVAGATGSWIGALPSALGTAAQSALAGIAAWGTHNTMTGVCSSCHSTR